MLRERKLNIQKKHIENLNRKIKDLEQANEFLVNENARLRNDKLTTEERIRLYIENVENFQNKYKKDLEEVKRLREAYKTEINETKTVKKQLLENIKQLQDLI